MKKLIFSTVVGVFAVASVAAASSLTQSQMDAIISMLHAFNVEESVIANVRISLTGGGSITPPTQWCHTFNVNLKIGDSDKSPVGEGEIGALRSALTREGFEIGDEHSSNFPAYFGESTAAAVTGFQEKYKNEILTPSGLQRGTGYVGPATRKKLNQLYGCSKPRPYLPPHQYPSSIPCTADEKQCSDGSYVSRTQPKCEFATCPSNSPQPLIINPSPLVSPSPQLLLPPKTLTKPIPNVLILEIPGNDPSRFPSTGNVSMDALVQKFYKIYPDEFDMLITFDVGKYNGQYNAWSNGFMRRYVPSNIGYIDECDSVENRYCKGYPTRLRYTQHVSMESDPVVFSSYTFVHELGHYWGVGWGNQHGQQCYDPWASYVYDFPSGHWSSNFEAGPLSVLVGGALQTKNDTYPKPPRLSRIIDSKDGTFTSVDIEGGTTTERTRFNNIDLYAMGLMTKEELATKDMFVIYDLERKGSDGNIYYGVRKNITLGDFKTMLKQKSACENKNYYTGDGSRVLNSYDKGKELAKDFRIAFVFVKHPEQEISNKKAREICQAVNYDYPKAWNDATYGLSTIHTYLSETSKNPDCKSLFPPSLD